MPTESSTDLAHALEQIAHIRRRVDQAAVSDGYRPAATAFSGVFAVLVATAQPLLLPHPTEHPAAYVALWVAVATNSALVAGGPLLRRILLEPPAWRRRQAISALSRLGPALLAGAAVTGVLMQAAPHLVWLLPGFWAVCFALGLFASLPVLPGAMGWVAGFYLLCGVAALAWARADAACSPLAMGIPFGVGQLASAAVLYLHERDLFNGTPDDV